MSPILGRVRHAVTLYGSWLMAIVGGAFTLLGFITFVRDNFVPPATRTQWDTFLLLPHWSGTTWLLVALGVLLVGAIEGSYRLQIEAQARAASAQSEISRVSEELRLLDVATAAAFEDDFVVDNRMRLAPVEHIRELRKHFDGLMVQARAADRAALGRLRRMAPKLDAVSLQCYASSMGHVEDVRRLEELVRLSVSLSEASPSAGGVTAPTVIPPLSRPT